MGSSQGSSSYVNIQTSFYLQFASSEDFGNYLIAKEDIPAKVLILSETPLCYSPSDEQDTETGTVFIFCLNCCKRLDDDERDPNECGEGKDLSEYIYHCSKCGWPVCDKICEMAPVHAENECKFFFFLHQNHTTYPPPKPVLMYKSVMLLRLLILIHKSPHEIWDNFLEKLEHHTKIREEKPHCVSADDALLENLQYFTNGLFAKIKKDSKKKRKYNLPFLQDLGMLKRIIGNINVNAFCANSSSQRIARCMFKKASLFSHSCAPNCAWTIEMSSPKESSTTKRKHRNGNINGFSLPSPPQIQVYSSIDIATGEMITISYNTRHTFEGTLPRQLFMENTGHFTCRCRRCMSSTELETYMSAIRCFRCESGFLVTSDPSNDEARWVCMKIEEAKNTSPIANDEKEECNYKFNVGKVVYFTCNIQDRIDKIRSKDLEWNEEVEQLQKLREKYFGKDLHENHYLLYEMSKRIVKLLESRLTNYESDYPAEKRLSIEKQLNLIDTFHKHVNYLKKIGDLILPGFNNHQDQLQYYVQ